MAIRIDYSLGLSASGTKPQRGYTILSTHINLLIEVRLLLESADNYYGSAKPTTFVGAITVWARSGERPWSYNSPLKIIDSVFKLTHRAILGLVTYTIVCQ